MGSNILGGTGAAGVADVLRASCSSVVLLSLENCEIRDVGAVQIAQALVGCASLKYLDLENNQVGDEGASKLADALAGKRALKHLNLSWNQIGDQGAGRLVDALASCWRLTRLSLLAQSTSQGETVHLDSELVEMLRWVVVR